MAIFISPRKPSKMQMRRKSSKPSNGLNRLVYRLCMESILMKRSIIIIRPGSRSEIGLNKQDLKFSQTVMARYGTTTSCYESYRFIQRLKQRLTRRAPDPHTSTGVMMVGVSAFSGSLRGLKLVPSKWRCRVPPTSPHQGATRRVTQAVGPIAIIGKESEYRLK